MLDRIFLISHMRANTSLIGHILGSHAEISGYYEMHLAYQTASDLYKQKEIYTEKETIKAGTRYLFDKLLHNSYPLEREKIANKDIHIKLLVSLRKPEQTIKSIINLFSKKQGNHPYADPQQACRYYMERLTTINDFCEQNQGQYFYYDAESIRNDTNNCLTQLSDYLELSTPLSSSYQLFSQTGKERVGDSSEQIKSGRVITHGNSYAEIELDSELLNKANSLFNKLRQNIIDNAKPNPETNHPKPHDLVDNSVKLP